MFYSSDAATYIAYAEARRTCAALADSLLRWETARPFVVVGADPYGRSLIFALIEALERAKTLAATMQLHDCVGGYELWIQLCLCKLNETPPPIGPAKAGFFFFTK